MLKTQLGLGTGARLWGTLEDGAVVRTKMDSETGKVIQAASRPMDRRLSVRGNSR